MSERIEAMRHHQVYGCPEWCTQPEGPEGEDQYEAHVGPWSACEMQDGSQVSARPFASWFDDGDDTVEVQFSEPHLGLTRTDLDAVHELLYQAERELDDFGREKWAYPGAEADQTGAGEEPDPDYVDGEVVGEHIVQELGH